MLLIFLVLIGLVAANPCPYCHHENCSLTVGNFHNCTKCHDIAALLIVLKSETPNSVRLNRMSVCQLCPSHCSKCQRAVVNPPQTTEPTLVINCTSCHNGYTTDHRTGKCQPCPQNCNACAYDRVQYAFINEGVINCTNCIEGYTTVFRTGECVACPQNCASCRCFDPVCPPTTLNCDSCEEGFELQPRQPGAIENRCVASEGRRLYGKEQDLPV